MSRGEGHKRKSEVKDTTTGRIPITTVLLERLKKMKKIESLDEETTRMVERFVILRLPTKTHQPLDPPARNETGGDERAGGVDEIGKCQRDLKGDVS